MSDLERANEFYLTMLDAARREGAKAMRERAAQKAESDDWSDVYGWNPVALHIAAAIRALPLTPEEPT